jgi:hypothetical protein
MKTIKILTLICFSVFMATSVSFGQTDSSAKNNSWTYTFSGGSMLSYGYLRQMEYYPLSEKNGKDWYGFPIGISERKWGLGLAINKQLSPIFNFGVQIQKGNLAGVNSHLDRYFETHFVQYGLNGVLNFGNIIFPNLTKNNIYIYVTAGIGYIDFKSELKKISTNELISYSGSDEKRTTELVIPYGFGFKFKFFKNAYLGLESTINNVNSYKIDLYRNLSKDKKDWFGYNAVTFTYNIGPNLLKPIF